MNKTWIIVGIIVVVLIGLGIMLGYTNNSSSVSTDVTPPSTDTTNMNPGQTSGTTDTIPPSTGTQGQIVAVKEFTVTGKNYSFSPLTLTVNKGDTVKITFKNAGGMHDLRIDEFNVSTKRIGDGEQDVVQFVADKAGMFAYYCSVGNHRAMGMEGTLVVK